MPPNGRPRVAVLPHCTILHAAMQHDRLEMDYIGRWTKSNYLEGYTRMFHVDHAMVNTESEVHVNIESSESARVAADQTQTLARRRRSGRTLSLALQGGGSFGAFTWGFLD